jgi:hypothetical protein
MRLEQGSRGFGEQLGSAGPLTLALSQEERGPEHGGSAITASGGVAVALSAFTFRFAGALAQGSAVRV